MSEHAISVSGVGKKYRIVRREDQATTAAEQLGRRLRHPRQRTKTEDFHALSDVSFEIPWGEAVGVIGRNGAGKSTLLKILTRITAPSTGRIELGGRVGSLLEVGTGFHPELTGRENVFLNGTLLGMRRKEIVKRFDEIVAFSGVEKFLDTQVKRYSTGMYIRLAFSVAAHLETEILAVDEVLAVGDAEFQAKCLAKMRQVAQDGRTVLLVSHQIQTVTSLCTSAMYLDSGRLLTHGTVETAVDLYKRSFTLAARTDIDAERRPGTGELRFTDVKVGEELYEPSDTKKVSFKIAANADFVGQYYLSAHIVDQDGVIVMQCDSRVVGFWLDGADEVEAELAIGSPWLRPGTYTVDTFICKSGVMDAWTGACSFQVLPILPYPHATSADGIDRGLVLGDFSYGR